MFHGNALPSMAKYGIGTLRTSTDKRSYFFFAKKKSPPRVASVDVLHPDTLTEFGGIGVNNGTFYLLVEVLIFDFDQGVVFSVVTFF